MFATAVRFLAKKGKGKKVNPADMNIGVEGQQWSGTLLQIVKERGPLKVASFWEEAQSSGLKSKSHMKVILKWMRGQNRVKLVCNHHIGGDKRSPTEREFLYAYVVPRSERLPKGDATTTATIAEGNIIPSSADASPPSHVEDQKHPQI